MAARLTMAEKVRRFKQIIKFRGDKYKVPKDVRVALPGVRLSASGIPYYTAKHGINLVFVRGYTDVDAAP